MDVGFDVDIVPIPNLRSSQTSCRKNDVHILGVSSWQLDTNFVPQEELKNMEEKILW
jgi:hypothetical protein